MALWLPACAPLWSASTRWKPASLPRLLSEPVVEPGAREADVPAHPMARQAASPHGLIDPARLDVEIPGGLLWAKESILRKGGRWLCCRCWSLHALYRSPTARTGQRIWRHLVVSTWRGPSAPKRRRNFPPGASAPPRRPSREIGREIVGPIRTRCYAPKPCVCRAFLDAGGGTRTPDTRIMIRVSPPQIGSS
jgi:hypothetical protein